MSIKEYPICDVCGCKDFEVRGKNENELPKYVPASKYFEEQAKYVLEFRDYSVTGGDRGDICAKGHTPREEFAIVCKGCQAVYPF